MQNNDYNLWDKFWLKVDGISGYNGGIPRDYKCTFYWPFGTRDKAKESMKEVLEWDFDKILILHGSNVESDAKNYLKKRLSFIIE